jgi:hypothetical protein
MKFVTGAFASACLFAMTVAANADTIVNDTTDVISYHGSSSTKYFSGSKRGDVIGSGFDTKSVSISESGHSITLKFLTQFDGDDLTAHYADLFITPNNADSSPASWGFGVSLGFQQPYGGEAAGLYALSSAADYMTSLQIWTPKTEYTYGGRYIAPGEITKNLIPTRITGGLLESDWTVAVSKTSVGGNYPYELSITLTAANSSAFSLLDGTNLDVLWGTGDCGNDTIFAQYTRPVKTPEPASIALLAGGLLVLRRRRK